MFEYLIVFCIVFIANVLPIFGPPTWMILSVLAITYDLPLLEIVIVGAIASSLGRYVLAKYVGVLSERYLPKKQKKGIKHLRNFLSYESGFVPFIVSFVYALSPLPSNIIFIVAGAARLGILSIISGFFIGRLISYSIIVGVVKALVSTSNLFSLAYILLDVIGIGLALGILFADWDKIIKHMIEKEKSRRAESAVKEMFE